ncbi:MAG: DinB family protein [Acidimicrobiales bacterium]
MIDEFAKEYLHGDLCEVRETMLWKLDGLTDYDVRRPLTYTGTNLLGLIKHLSTWEARYFGEVFERPFPEPLASWDADAGPLADMWATEDESRAEIVDLYRRVWVHSDATIAALDIDAPGHVPWWPRPDVKLFNILVHVLTETNRHAGHADILREQLDGAVGTDAGSTALQELGTAFWVSHRARIEQAAKAAAHRRC